jgi:hypothetical protein
MANNQTKKQVKRWTAEEDKRLLQQVRVFPQNLHKCFITVAEVTGRTPTACASRWYTKLSKDPANAVFLTVSSRHKIMNRKNGKGVRSTPSLFQRILKLLKFG